jgi:hypothetical protein
MYEMKYRLDTLNEYSKSIENLYVNHLKKCYESMDIEKRESLKVNYKLNI